MKHKILRGIIAIWGCLLLWGCTEEDLVQQSTIGGLVDVALNFGATDHEQVEIKTRTTYDLYYESMIRNVYAFVFAGNDKVYGRYFGTDDLNQTGNKEYWTVNNMNLDNTGRTSGTLHMSVPSVSTNAEIILIANIDLDFMNVSEDRLGLVRTKEELNELIVSLNQEISDRNAGYFMMTGSKSGVSINGNGAINIPNNILELKRLDAKVEVNVRINPNEVSNGQQVVEFTPTSWQVMNLPKKSHLIPNDYSLQLSEDSYFNINPKKFEFTENERNGNVLTGAVLYGFSFYTLENKRSGDKKKSVLGDYHNRDRRNKHYEDPLANNYGSYNNQNGMWEYAPELATYIIIKGELQVVVDQGKTSEQHLIADATYYIHLGDFATDKDNYDINRNTHYKYTINVKGVNNIEIEVNTSNDNLAGIEEKQPGAMGHLYEVEENTHTFDAHYGQCTYTIRASEVDIQNIEWYVRTPFGREGVPLKDESGKDIYNDLDYKWVEFMLNDKKTNSNEYSKHNMPYPADKSKLMYVIDMLNIVKTEYIAWNEGRESLFDDNGEMTFSVFVDEYYYDQNPMNPNDDPGVLWKKFVNQPNRLLHIIRKNSRSADDDSSITESLLTIRQNSIQTPFNINPTKNDLRTAWGCETSDETKNQAWFYHPDERYDNFNKDIHKPKYTPDNISRTDGLYNTACLLNLVSGTGNSKVLNTSLRWDTYLNYEEDEVKLKDEYKAGLYSVLLRNRDLDGDGYIDPEELRWYIASLDQLCGLFLGDQGINSDAQLYPIEASRKPNIQITEGPFAGCYPWRLHVVSSTAMYQIAGNSPTIIWAEEGASTGEYQEHWGKQGYSPVRCMRNLGMSSATASNIMIAGNNYPKDSLVKVSRPKENIYEITPEDVYKFDFTNMNEESRRYFTSRELIPGNEYSIMSRLYDGFETGELINIGINYHGDNGLKSILENGEKPQGSPQGYRVPNIREGVAMYLYCDGQWWWWNNNDLGTMVSDYYSFGYYGRQYEWTHSWTIFGSFVTLENKGYTYVRFVKDIQP